MRDVPARRVRCFAAGRCCDALRTLSRPHVGALCAAGKQQLAASATMSSRVPAVFISVCVCVCVCLCVTGTGRKRGRERGRESGREGKRGESEGWKEKKENVMD